MLGRKPLSFWKEREVPFENVNIALVIVGAILGLALGAVVLRLSCGLVQEERPSLGRAIVIFFVALLCQATLGGLLGFLGLANARSALFFAVWLVSSAVYSFMLPAKFLHALMIWLCQIVILCISFFLLGIFFQLVSRAF